MDDTATTDAPLDSGLGEGDPQPPIGGAPDGGGQEPGFDAETMAALEALRGQTPKEYDGFRRELGGIAPGLESLGYSGQEILPLVQRAEELGITPEQFRDLAKELQRVGNAQRDRGRDAADAEAFERGQAQLHTDWGRDVRAKATEAERLMQRVLGPFHNEIVDARLEDGTRVGDWIAFNNAFAEAGSAFTAAAGTDAHSGESAALALGAMSPQQAKDRIEQLYADKSFTGAYFSASHPLHEQSLRRMDGLSRIAHAGESVSAIPEGGISVGGAHDKEW